MLIQDFKNSVATSLKLLLHPQQGWSSIERLNDGKDFKAYNQLRYMLILTVSIQLIYSCISSFSLNSILFCCIYVISCYVGTIMSIKVIKEFSMLKEKQTIERLVIYSATIYYLFNGISLILMGGFLEQLFLCIGLMYGYTLYMGIKEVAFLSANNRTSLWLIIFITILVIPYIIRKLLCTVFSIPIYKIIE